MKIKEVDVTNPELDAFEDLATIWILCNKHIAQTINKNEVEVFKMQNSCKACQKEKRMVKNRALYLWGKLVRAYDAAQHGKG